MSEMQRVNNFEDNWLDNDVDDDLSLENPHQHHHHHHHSHSQDDADTDQQSVSQFADGEAEAHHLRGRRHENESISTAYLMYQAGYRDGAAKGSEVAFQNRFDAGFERGITIGRLIGELWLEIQKVLKQLPKESENMPQSNITTTASADGTLEMQVSQTSNSTLFTEAVLLRAQAEKCLTILLKDLPELLATVSPPATAPISSTLGIDGTHVETSQDVQESLQLSAALASVVIEDATFDNHEQHSEVARLQQIRQEKEEINSVLHRLRQELKYFPAVALLVFEDLVSQLGMN